MELKGILPLKNDKHFRFKIVGCYCFIVVTYIFMTLINKSVLFSLLKAILKLVPKLEWCNYI